MSISHRSSQAKVTTTYVHGGETKCYTEEPPEGKVGAEEDDRDWEKRGHNGTDVGDEVEDERREAEEETEIGAKNKEDESGADSNDHGCERVDLVMRRIRKAVEPEIKEQSRAEQNRTEQNGLP